LQFEAHFFVSTFGKIPEWSTTGPAGTGDLVEPNIWLRAIRNQTDLRKAI
jgi:hypothetical protein